MNAMPCVNLQYRVPKGIPFEQKKQILLDQYDRINKVFENVAEQWEDGRKRTRLSVKYDRDSLLQTFEKSGPLLCDGYVSMEVYGKKCDACVCIIRPQLYGLEVTSLKLCLCDDAFDRYVHMVNEEGLDPEKLMADAKNRFRDAKKVLERLEIALGLSDG